MQSTLNRLVHASTRRAIQTRGLKSSDGRSTRFGGLSTLIVNIHGRIQIAVMVLTALWAIPLSGSESKTGQNVATAMAPLRGWEEAIHKPQVPAMSLTLVSEHLTELTERSIGERFSEAMVSDHTSDVQVFDADSVVSANQVGGHLVKVILPGIANVFMDLSNANSLLIPPAAALDATRENSLSLGKSHLVLVRMLGVRDSLVVAGSSQAVNSKIAPHGLSGGFELGKLFVETQSYKVTSTGSLGNCDSRGLGVEFSTPIHIQPAQPTDGQIGIAGIRTGELESRDRIFSTLFISALLEVGILSFLIEESHEGIIQVAEGLLSGNTGNVLEPTRLNFFLPLGQFKRRLVVANSLLAHLPSVSSISQRPVIDVPTTTKDLCKLYLLGYGWCKSKLIPNLHPKTVYA